MKHKLSDIFKTDNIESKRRILNRFELTKEDKADIINMSGKSNGGGSGTEINYYKWDTSKCQQLPIPEDKFEHVMFALQQIYSSLSVVCVYSKPTGEGAMIYHGGGYIISIHSNEGNFDILGFGYIPIYDIYADKFKSLYECIIWFFDNVSIPYDGLSEQEIFDMFGLTAITKEQFYNLSKA